MPIARGFLPVYFRGDGDLNAAGDFAFMPLFFVDPDSLGVACMPVTWVGESTVKSSSSSSCWCAPACEYSSWSVGVSSCVEVCSVFVTSSSFVGSSYPDNATFADASKNCFQNCARRQSLLPHPRHALSSYLGPLPDITAMLGILLNDW